MLAIGLEPAAGPIELVVFVALVRPLVEIAVQCDLVAMLEQKVDLRRVFLDDPARNEEGQAQIAARELLDEARDRDQRVVARPGLCRDEIVGGLLIVPVEGTVGVHVPGHRDRAARPIWPRDRGRNQMVVATQPGGTLRWQGDGGRIERYGTS